MQTLQAVAFASGLLSLEEAQTIYHALGGEAARWDFSCKLSLKHAVLLVLGDCRKRMQSA